MKICVKWITCRSWSPKRSWRQCEIPFLNTVISCICAFTNRQVSCCIWYNFYFCISPGLKICDFWSNRRCQLGCTRQSLSPSFLYLLDVFGLKMAKPMFQRCMFYFTRYLRKPHTIKKHNVVLTTSSIADALELTFVISPRTARFFLLFGPVALVSSNAGLFVFTLCWFCVVEVTSEARKAEARERVNGRDTAFSFPMFKIPRENTALKTS